MNEIDKKLYELFADKTLSEGCKIYLHWFSASVIQFTGKNLKVWRDNWYRNYPYPLHIWDIEDKKNIEILWHPPQLHDVFRLSKEKWLFPLVQTEDFTNYYIGIAWENTPYREIPYNPAITLLKQEESTKQAIIDLFKN